MGAHNTLTRITAKYRKGEWPTHEETSALLSLSASSAPGIREAALTLLLHPPINDELAYLKDCLFPQAHASLRKGSFLPEELVERICDVLGLLGKMPMDADMRETIVYVLSTLKLRSVERLLNKPLPLQPFLPYLEMGALSKLFRASDYCFLRRWRLFRRKICEGKPSYSWSEVTCKSINSVRQNGRTKRAVRFRKGRWLGAMRPLFLAPRSHPVSPPVLSRFSWPGFGNLAKCRMETLMQLQAEELVAVRELTQVVSEQTGRVVLSWHNATLAAAGGWAFPALTENFPSEGVRKRFLESVQKRKKAYEESLDRGEIHHLFAVWEDRLIRPKILHALWESQVRAGLDASLKRSLESDLEAVEEYLAGGRIPGILKTRGLGWHDVLSPHQRWGVKDVLDWRFERKRLWQEGLPRFAAIIAEGQKLLNAGDLPFLVLPWIDKFFISSRREEDLLYFPAIVQWIENQGLEPLVILWEDTSHAFSPSLQLALKRLCDEGKRYRGLGVFDWKGSARADALNCILREHSRCRLFALRPHSDTHNHLSFHHLIERMDHEYFEFYDSSWKDNLAFLYVGTQVHPLLSPQSEAEDIPAWLGGRGFRYPFGAYFRSRLRKELACAPDPRMDRLSRQYAFWANLC